VNRKAIAQDTLEILKAGCYTCPSGSRVEIDGDLASCIAGTQCYDPDELTAIERQVLAEAPQFLTTEFEVRNETTLMGAEPMARSRHFDRIGVLNFASAKNPGGGFLNGAQAQEESLARSSGLYQSLLKCPDYYDFHRSHKSLLYSNRIIYSPGCPVFRQDDGTLLEDAYLVDFITSPAPNAGAIAKNQPKDLGKIGETLRDRGSKVLSLAVDRGCDALVLGAWGCGVFQNDPSMVSQMFADLLLDRDRFGNRFKTVLFSVLDTSQKKGTIAAFRDRFSGK